VKIASIAITHRCNERCFYCEQPRDGREMSLARFEEVLTLAQAEGCTALALGGGEPTLHSHLEELLRLGREKGFLLTLTTNARDPDMVRGLLKKGLLDGCGVSVGKGRWQELAALPQTTANILLLHGRLQQALADVLAAWQAGFHRLLLLAYKGRNKELVPSEEELAGLFALVGAWAEGKEVVVGADLYTYRRLGLRNSCGNSFLRFDLDGRQHKCCFAACEFY